MRHAQLPATLLLKRIYVLPPLSFPSLDFSRLFLLHEEEEDGRGIEEEWYLPKFCLATMGGCSYIISKEVSLCEEDAIYNPPDPAHLLPLIRAPSRFHFYSASIFHPRSPVRTYLSIIFFKVRVCPGFWEGEGWKKQIFSHG